MNILVLFSSFGALSLVVINSKAIRDVVTFSVAVLGGHSSLRRMLFNSFLFWLGQLVVLIPCLMFVGLGVEYGLGLSGESYRIAGILVSTLCLINSSVILAAQKPSVIKKSKIRKSWLEKRRVSISRSAGSIHGDLLFGSFFAAKLVLSSFGIILGSFWLVDLILNSWKSEVGLFVFVASSLIWLVVLLLSYGLNISEVERFRKNKGYFLGLAEGIFGVLCSWAIIAKLIGLL